MISQPLDRPDSSPPTAAESVTAGIISAGLIGILRAPTAEHFEAIAAVLVDTGVLAIEITLTAADAVHSLAKIATEHGGRAFVGAGTVLTADQAEACIDAGATFLVSPTASPDVIAAARIADVAAFPGALTPTEILAAHRSGASAVKLFPASAVAPRYLSDLRGPLPDIRIIPTGGIAIDDITAWIRVGAAAVGLGSSLLGDAVTQGADKRLTARTKQAVRALVAARTPQ